MKIAVDMDNTLVDELGAKLRPGIVPFLEALSRGHELVLWTNSRKQRAYDILSHHGLRGYFSGMICREDYDPEEKGMRKDLGRFGIDCLIDDDPVEVEFNASRKKKAFLVKSFRNGASMDKNELAAILTALSRL